LGLNDLLIAIGANFNYSLVVLISRMRDSEHVLPGRN
jgi:hypothetical protein